MIPSPLRSVLYVDDEPDIREIVQLALGLTPAFTVHTAESGEQALAHASTLLPDLVLLDVMMPGLDGPATLDRMRSDARTAHIPVIFVTAKAMPREVALLQRMGAAGVIAKPFDPMQLGALVHSLWRQRIGDATPPDPAPAPAPAPSLRQHVTQFARRFLQRTRPEVARLSSLVEHMQPADAALLVELQELAHRIHGSGATFGFVALSQRAEDLELLVRTLRHRDASADTVVNAHARQRLKECTQRLATEVATAAAHSGYPPRAATSGSS